MKNRYNHTQAAFDDPVTPDQEARLRSLIRTARPLPEPSGELAQRILSTAAQSSRQPPRTFAFRFRGHADQRRRLVGGLALTAGLALTLLVWPHSHKIYAASRVQAALADVNTWHLKGWKLLDGHRVPWEIWGRRHPFFYREQAGSEIVLDDGSRRTRLIPADRARGRAEDIVLQTPSQPGIDSMAWAPVVQAQRWQAAIRPWKETARIAVFKLSDGPDFEPGYTRDYLYTVSKLNWLPAYFSVRRSDHHLEWTAEYLAAAYNVPLSAQISTLRWSKEARVVNAVNSSMQRPTPQENIAAANGLRVQATPLAIDAQGNVLMRLRGWLGDVRLNGSTGPLYMKTYAVRSWLNGSSHSTPYSDESGNSYVEVPWPLPGGLDLPNGDRLILFAPLEPLEGGAGLPNRLTVQLTVEPGIATAMPGMHGWTRVQGLFAEELSWSVTLPDRVGSTDLAAYIPADLRHRFLDSAYTTREQALARARKETRENLAGSR